MALFSILMSVQMTFAQQNMFVVDSNGNVETVNASSVNYATFNANSKWFNFSYKNDCKTLDRSISSSCNVELATDTDIKELDGTPEVGVCYSKDNVIPTIDDNCKSLGSGLKYYTISLSYLIPGTTYYYRAYVKLNDGVIYGDVVQATTTGTKPVDNSKIINGHKFVDLWLPSGLLWAETNIGAETAADDGNYYAWGDTLTKDTYTYIASGSGSFYSGNIIRLKKEQDAAYINWGDSCMVPGYSDLCELTKKDNCSWTWTSMTNSSGKSINGYKVTSRLNGNSIFLPASGYRTGDKLYKHDSEGCYWSLEKVKDNEGSAIRLTFTNIEVKCSNAGNQSCGLTIRPVAEP